ncbi:[protein-PII] uridylyltransferase [Desulfococcus sp.]|uniref:[protein-PII] uridylyltransferase n=1 Tax=Desulfococcus sp. TaxID=2025834 RepID=UPI0035932679
MTTRSDKPVRTLALRRKALIEDFLKGDVPDFVARYTRFLDDYFHESYENSVIGPKLDIRKNPYAIIALGGYGREEQCIHSDVDLLVLFEREIPDAAMGLIREVIYPLWDIGVEVGHATRTLEECIVSAVEDIETLTALLDARFICGMSRLYSRLLDLLREKIVRDDPDAVIERVVLRNRERHESFGDSTYLLEPNLKEGQGGLRDYHTMLWVARIRNQLTQPRDLEYHGCLSHEEYRNLSRALAFIWRVRNYLHYLSRRKCDQLYFSYQEKMAQALGYEYRDGQQPVERFLGDLHQHMGFLKQQQQMVVYELEMERSHRRGRKSPEKPHGDGLVVVDGMLNFASSKAIPRQPEILMGIFEESARLKLPLSIEARRLVREFRHCVDAAFRTSGAVRRSFEQILLTPVPKFNVLEAMSETEFLEAYIPQFNEIVHRIQYDEYHLYPVHRHLLRTVQTIKKFGTPDDPTTKPLCGQLYADQSHAERITLIWAGLLHDIGKGKSIGNHSEMGEVLAREILAEKGYPPETIETVAFLVREHLFLAKIATRRDIQDEETALHCARRIGNPGRLKMLHLLTVADSVATGPKAWNGWTAALLEELYLNVCSTFRDGELTSAGAVQLMEEKKAFILGLADGPETLEAWESLFRMMSPRYLINTARENIADHIALYNRLGKANFVWKVEKSPGRATRTVTICARDCPGLFSRISGVFTLNGMDILAAQVYTWRNNIALDVFEVNPPPDSIYESEKWAHAEADLESALLGSLDLGAALKEKMEIYAEAGPLRQGRPPRVKVDNEISSFFTVVEVFSYDFLGLLYKITDALFKCRLDVWVAKIATKVDQVVDVFYVRDFDGQKADSPEQVAAIRTALMAVLTERPDEENGNF